MHEYYNDVHLEKNLWQMQDQALKEYKKQLPVAYYSYMSCIYWLGWKLIRIGTWFTCFDEASLMSQRCSKYYIYAMFNTIPFHAT